MVHAVAKVALIASVMFLSGLAVPGVHATELGPGDDRCEAPVSFDCSTRQGERCKVFVLVLDPSDTGIYAWV